MLADLTGQDSARRVPPQSLVSGPAPSPAALSGLARTPGPAVAVLSPGVVEILASLDAPERPGEASRREERRESHAPRT